MTARRRPRWRRAAVTVAALACAAGAGATSVAGGTPPSAPDVPYALDASLPAAVRSPAVDPAAPYTPVVRSLIRQLEPDSPPTAAELANAAKLFQGGLGQVSVGGSCTGVGVVAAPTGTVPSISPLCWADSVGINIVSGANIGKTSATPEPLALGASFDPALANAWGQVEGLEGRQLMVTGLYGPEADVAVQTTWERGLDTLGEDPYVNEVLAAAQVDGMQGRGLMAQVKHFAAFSGANRYTLTRVGDQAMHELLLTPFERAFTDARAASTMCAYDEYQDTSAHLPAPANVLYRPSPYGTTTMTTWPLDERHWACEQPFGLSYVLRGLWHSDAFVGSDFPATHSTAALAQGETQEFPVPLFFAATDPAPVTAPLLGVGTGTDPTGDTCAIASVPAPCDAQGAAHVGGIPGVGCDPANGCGLVTAVVTGHLPLAVFNQALAEVLYQEERFGLLGCDDTPRAATCWNPGGIGTDRSGSAPLPAGPATGATPARALGTKDGDAAVVERIAEEGAVLLKDESTALPLTAEQLRQGVAVSGAGAEYLVAEPSNEASTGFPDRISISPLRQLEQLGPAGSRMTFTPALDPTGITVPPSALSTVSGHVDGALARTGGPGAGARDAMLDFTRASPRGQLSPGDYTWSGFVYVPAQDTYTFRFQYTPGTTSLPAQVQAPVSLSLDGSSQQLSAASSFYCGQYYAHNVCVPVGTTNAGYTEPGLTNVQTTPRTLAAGYHAVSITFRDDTSAPASLRFGYSRAGGDAADAAAAARGKAAAVVFVNDNGVPVIDQDAYTPPTRGVAALPDAQVRLIDAVAGANPNTIVVLNTADPVVAQPWIDNPHVRAVLEMWNAGSEGGTATARLLLGQAAPTGHTTMTWPVHSSDTTYAYRQTRPLYAGDTTGAHPERLNGETGSAADCASYVPAPSPCTQTTLSGGIFSGYRYADREGVAPQIPFGFGLTYTSFRYSGLRVSGSAAGATVSFSVTNTGARAGTDVAQVYVGAGPARPGIQQAVRALRGFARVSVPAGATRRVTVPLEARSFQYWDEKTQRWTTDAGARRIWVGDADDVHRLPLSTLFVVGQRPTVAGRSSAPGRSYRPTAPRRSLAATGLRPATATAGLVAAVGGLVLVATRRRRRTGPSEQRRRHLPA